MGFNNGYDSGYDDGFADGVKSAQQNGGLQPSPAPSSSSGHGGPTQASAPVPLGLKLAGHVMQLVPDWQTPEYDTTKIPVCWGHDAGVPALNFDVGASGYSDIGSSASDIGPVALVVKGQNFSFENGEESYPLMTFRDLTLDLEGSDELARPGVYMYRYNPESGGYGFTYLGSVEDVLIGL